VVLNALQGGIVDNSAIVQAGVDGGIQVLATDDCDLVIDMNGYYVQATSVQGPPGPQAQSDPQDQLGPSDQPVHRELLERQGRLVRVAP
jgi:hypothetical protein